MRRRRRGFWIAVTAGAVTGVLVCGCWLTASGYMVWYHRRAVHEQQRTAEFASAARQGVVNMTSMDFHRAKDDVQRVIDSSTGQFRDDFQSTAADLTSTLEQGNVVSEGTVNATAVESMNDNSGVVLVAVASKVTNSAGAQQEPRYLRLSVTMTRDGGQLKMSKVELLP
jgi:Mce-associated membrane protein